MAGITDPAARARSYVARETGLREERSLLERVTALERARSDDSDAAGRLGRPPAWTMVEVLAALPAPTSDMAGRLAALRRDDGFLVLCVCILDAEGTPAWAAAMALATEGQGGRQGAAGAGGIASVAGELRWVPV